MAQTVSITIAQIVLKLCHMTLAITRDGVFFNDHRAVWLDLDTGAWVSCAIRLFACGRRQTIDSRTVAIDL